MFLSREKPKIRKKYILSVRKYFEKLKKNIIIFLSMLVLIDLKEKLC